MAIPRFITEAVTALRAERLPLAARLDAIDLAIDNLSRVYGLHGTPQPLPLERARRTPARNASAPKAPREVKTGGRSDEAIARRDTTLALIAKSAHGLTGRDISKATAQMDEAGRRNALSILKATGKIKRTGNVWQTLPVRRSG